MDIEEIIAKKRAAQLQSALAELPQYNLEEYIAEIDICTDNQERRRIGLGDNTTMLFDTEYKTHIEYLKGTNEYEITQSPEDDACRIINKKSGLDMLVYNTIPADAEMFIDEDKLKDYKISMIFGASQGLSQEQLAIAMGNEIKKIAQYTKQNKIKTALMLFNAEIFPTVYSS